MATTYETYAAFLADDTRRRGDVLELGHDWFAGDGRYRVCWYAPTGELTAERLDRSGALDIEDFDAGVSGPVLIIAAIPSRTKLEAALGRWPSLPRARPHTLARLRQLTAG